jgi:hypothetical protein
MNITKGRAPWRKALSKLSYRPRPFSEIYLRMDVLRGYELLLRCIRGVRQPMFPFQLTQRLVRSHWIRPAQLALLFTLGVLGLQSPAAAVRSVATPRTTPISPIHNSSISSSPNSHQPISSGLKNNNQQAAIQLAMVNAVPLPRASGRQLKDGLHFFGESRERDQLGKMYMVFEVEGDKVVGALFAPRSSYSCFEGRFSNNQLALRIDDPYGDEVYLQEIALESTAIIASSNINSVPMQMGLEGMYALGSVNRQDKALLTTCKAEL